MSLRRNLAQRLLPLAMATMLLAGCNSNDSGNGGTPTDTSTDPMAAQLAYAQCMRKNGVDVPDPKSGDNGMVQLGPGAGSLGGDQGTFEKAQKACAKYVEDMGGTGPAGALSEADKEQMLQFAECMREHGVNVPDPDFNGGDGGVGFEIPSDPQGQANFDAAQKACQQFFGPSDGSS